MCIGKCDFSFVTYLKTNPYIWLVTVCVFLCFLDRTNIETQSLTLVDYILCGLLILAAVACVLIALCITALMHVDVNCIRHVEKGNHIKDGYYF